MTVAEYQEFVKKSSSFQTMSPLEQARILAARGEEMEGFIKIFQEEQALMQNAVADFYDKSEKVVKEFKTEAKEFKKAKLKVAETVEKKEEVKVTDKLLNMLDKL
jgi:very-short-patch-repair endonuclease